MMIPNAISITPESFARELADMTRQTVAGIETLSTIDSADIQVGCSAREAIWEEDGITLYRFTPRVAKPRPVPLLISYALVNRPYMVDLQEDRSLVRNLLDLGLDVYLVDWGYPTRADRWRTMDDYINGFLDRSVDTIRERSGQEAIHILGICQGGTFSLCYAAMHPEKVKALVTMVAPVDFHADGGADCGLLNAWARPMDIDLMVDALGNIPGDFMNLGFLMLKPFQLNIAKYSALLDIADDEVKVRNFLRMEKWIFDSPDQAGEAFRQFARLFFRENRLMHGTLELGGRPVDLRRITQPMLNIYGLQDHLVPPAASMPLRGLVGTRDYTELPLDVGHIGMYVSGRSQRDLPQALVAWLRRRSTDSRKRRSRK